MARRLSVAFVCFGDLLTPVECADLVSFVKETPVISECLKCTGVFCCGSVGLADGSSVNFRCLGLLVWHLLVTSAGQVPLSVGYLAMILPGVAWSFGLYMPMILAGVVWL